MCVCLWELRANSASENMINLRGIEQSGENVKLKFKSDEWEIKASSPDKACMLVKACVTLGMILYQGSPIFAVTVEKGKVNLSRLHLFEDPTDDYCISTNLPIGWELLHCDVSSRVVPLYYDHKTQTSHWTLPPDVMEQVSAHPSPSASSRQWPGLLCGSCRSEG
eukprot:3399068-Rhodomonas_salina.2